MALESLHDKNSRNETYDSAKHSPLPKVPSYDCSMHCFIPNSAPNHTLRTQRVRSKDIDNLPQLRAVLPFVFIFSFISSWLLIFLFVLNSQKSNVSQCLCLEESARHSTLIGVEIRFETGFSPGTSEDPAAGKQTSLLEKKEY